MSGLQSRSKISLLAWKIFWCLGFNQYILSVILPNNRYTFHSEFSLQNRRNFLRVKTWPNTCYIQTQQFNETSCKIFARNVLHTFGHLVVTCEMLDGDGSSLKMITFLLQHFRMLQDVAHILPAPLQHLIAQSYDVTKCCMRSTEPWQANRDKREGGHFSFRAILLARDSHFVPPCACLSSAEKRKNITPILPL